MVPAIAISATDEESLAMVAVRKLKKKKEMNECVTVRLTSIPKQNHKRCRMLYRARAQQIEPNVLCELSSRERK